MLGINSLTNIKKIISGVIAEDSNIIMPETLIILIEKFKEKMNIPCLVCQDGQYLSNMKTKKVYENFFAFALNLILSNLSQNKISDGMTMSFLVESTGHWTAVQLNIFQGKVYFFVLDAAASYKTDRVYTNIRKIFENKKFNHLFGKVYCTKPKIQKDGLNCSLFALHHIIKLSKFFDTFDYLRKKSYLFQPDTFYPKIILYVKIEFLHPKLLKGIQDFDLLKSYNNSSIFNTHPDFEKIKSKILIELQEKMNWIEYENKILNSNNKKFINNFFDAKRDKYSKYLKGDYQNKDNLFELYKNYVINHRTLFFKSVCLNQLNSNHSLCSYYTPASYQEYMIWRTEGFDSEI